MPHTRIPAAALAYVAEWQRTAPAECDDGIRSIAVSTHQGYTTPYGADVGRLAVCICNAINAGELPSSKHFRIRTFDTVAYSAQMDKVETARDTMLDAVQAYGANPTAATYAERGVHFDAYRNECRRLNVILYGFSPY